MLLGPIESALSAGGWVQIDWADKAPAPMNYLRAGQPVVGNVGAVGVVALVNPSKAADLMGSATAFASALTAEGIAAVAKVSDESTAANPNAIHVLIGHKPVE